MVYAYDPSDATKRARAGQLLAELAEREEGILSPQILSEFLVTVTKKIHSPLSPRLASHSVSRYLRSWRIAELSGWTVLEAAQAVERYSLNYWDALVWATAKLNQIPTVLSEDFSDGLILEGIRFRNPFVPAFELEALA